jgi:hypothetical protein
MKGHQELKKDLSTELAMAVPQKFGMINGLVDP